MKSLNILIIFIFFAIFATINYYIGLRGWQALGSKVPFLKKHVYWTVFSLISASYIIGHVIRARGLPSIVNKAITYTGSYWIAAFFYLVIILVIIDIIRSIDMWVGFLPSGLKNNPAASTVLGIFVAAVVAVLLLYGTWNARNPVITKYNVNIDKKAGSLEKLNIVMVSDVHLSTVVNRPRLEQMVRMINALNPDIILMPGDILDDDIWVFKEENMAEVMKQLKSLYGVYASIGNHEYISGNVNAAVKYMEEGGIKVLKDSLVKINDSFYIAGRDDSSGYRFNNIARKEPEEILQDIDRSLPVILMDHQPAALYKSEQAGVDLQVSGHTHKGQMFPNNFITKRVFEIDWGYLKKGNTHIIVSNGFGTWGPPIRIGSKPEIVNIVLNFKK